MRNLAIAGAGLIIVIIAVFLFASKQKTKDDTVIPTPTPIESPGLEFLKPKEATMAGNKKLYKQAPPVLKAEEIKGKMVRIKTKKGDIVFSLSENAPIASSNFIFLTNEKFYDGLTFHRVIKDFMIQGGDPLGTGSGGPGYTFLEDKIINNGKYDKGIVAMAKRGDEPPGTGGSQFFIMQSNKPLPPEYAIFGNVLSGIEIVDEIAESKVDQNDKPIEPIQMLQVIIEKTGSNGTNSSN